METYNSSFTAQDLERALGNSGGVDGYTLVKEITLDADVNGLTINTDADGNPLSLPGEVFLEIINPKAAGAPDCYATVRGTKGNAGQFATCRWANASAETKGYLQVRRIGGKVHVSFAAAQAVHYNATVGTWTQLFDIGNITKIEVRGGGGNVMMTGCVARLYARG